MAISTGHLHRWLSYAELGTAKGPTSLRRENQRRGAVLREDLLQGETEGGIRQQNGILEKYIYTYIYLFVYLVIYLLIYLFIYLFSQLVSYSKNKLFDKKFRTLKWRDCTI